MVYLTYNFWHVTSIMDVSIWNKSVPSKKSTCCGGRLEYYPAGFLNLQEVYDVINVVDHSIRLTVALAGLAMAGKAQFSSNKKGR